MTSSLCLLGALLIFTCCLGAVVEAEASDQQIVYIRNTCECWSVDLKCVCKIESDPTSVRPLMQRLVNRTAEYYWQDIEFQSMVYDRTTFILANTFADGPFPSGITFKGDFSIVNDSFNHLNMTLNKVELNFETFSGRKPKFSKQYWRYIFDHGEGTLRSLRIIKYQIEDFIIPNYLGAALTQEVRPLTEFKVVGCEVKEVKERAFKNFTQLEVLDLSDNHLTTLPENVFSRNINLQKILLANNQISFLTKTIFDGLPNLLLINLRKNKLTAVPAIPRHTNRRFQPMVYLMADNSIHCRCSLIWVLHELTFHHNLEIEATCSDPTMVRGMPIIEGFTRMDKEACYRLIRKEDGAGVGEVPALEGPRGALAIGAVARDEQLSVAAPAVRAQNQLVGKSAEEKTAVAAIEQKQSASVYGGAQDKLDATAGVGPAGASIPAEAQLYKSGASLGQTATNQMSAAGQEAAALPASSIPDAQNSLATLLTRPAQSQAASSNPIAVAAGATAAPSGNQHLEATFVESVAQAVAPQTPISGAAGNPADVVASPSHKQPLVMAASPLVAQQQQQQQQQLVNVAPQTVLTPVQTAVMSPVAAVAPSAEQASQQAAHQQNAAADQQTAAAPGALLSGQVGSGPQQS